MHDRPDHVARVVEREHGAQQVVRMNLVAQRRRGPVSRRVPSGRLATGVGRGAATDQPACLVWQPGLGMCDERVKDLAGKPSPRGTRVDHLRSPACRRFGAQAMISWGGAGNATARPAVAPSGPDSAEPGLPGIGSGRPAARASTA